MQLTHWGQATHICVTELVGISSGNGQSPIRHQAINWTNAGIFHIGALEKQFREIFIEIKTFPLKETRLKITSAKWWPLCIGLFALIIHALNPCCWWQISPKMSRKYVCLEECVNMIMEFDKQYQGHFGRDDTARGLRGCQL